MRTTSFTIFLATMLLSAGCHRPLESNEKHYGHRGEQAILTAPGQAEAVFVAVQKENSQALERACSKNDSSALQHLVKAGKAFETRSGGTVKVTAESFNERQVEILEGPQRGQRGWVPFEWLRPPQRARL